MHFISEDAPDTFHQSTDTDFWIGLEKLHPGGNWTWTDGTPVDFTDWKPGEPQNTTDANCAALSMTDGYWSAQDCFKTKPYVCAITPSTPPATLPPFVNCSQGWTYLQKSHSCYGVSTWGISTMTWTAAETYCQNLTAELPAIHSFEELRFVVTFVYEAFYDIWTGIYSVDSTKTWKTTDGSPADFLNYGPWCGGFPENITGQSCVGISAGCFFNYDCSHSYRALCKKQL